MAVRLIALDLDGTLFRDDKTVSEGNRKALMQARQNGAEIVIASGRPLHNIPQDVFRELGVRYMITANGACVHRLSDGARLYEDPMDREAAYELIRFCEQLPVLVCVLTVGETLVSKSKTVLAERPGTPEMFRHFINHICVPVDNLIASLETSGKPVYKLAVYFTHFSEDPERCYRLMLTHLENDPRFVQVDGGLHSMEITMADVSKGKALRWLAEQLKIDISETMACGDTENDLEILKTAGIGVAMGNAAPHVKAAADYVTRTNEEDGVAFAVRHFMQLE